MAGLSNDEHELLPSESLPFRNQWRRMGAAAVLVTTAIVVAFVAGRGTLPIRLEDSSDAIEEDMIETSPPVGSCAKRDEECGTSKCCAITGYKCYNKNSMFNGCVREGMCDQSKGWTCERPANILSLVQAEAPPGTEMFCFSLVVKDVGTPKKKPHDWSLIRTQLATKSSIFGCESYAVFSDIDTWLSPGGPGPAIRTIVIPAPHIGKRKTGAWINSPVFNEAWSYIKNNKMLEANNGIVDWVVKVDPDAVFLPGRLRTKLSGQKVTSNGIYITNCRYVKYGFFGSLEIFSKKAFETLLDNFDTCKTELDWKVKGKEYGEDKFAQLCMDRHGVDAIEDFSYTNDGVCQGIEKRAAKAKALGVEYDQVKKIVWKPNCGADKYTPAFHPFKKPEDYFTCLAETQK